MLALNLNTASAKFPSKQREKGGSNVKEINRMCCLTKQKCVCLSQQQRWKAGDHREAGENKSNQNTFSHNRSMEMLTVSSSVVQITVIRKTKEIKRTQSQWDASVNTGMQVQVRDNVWHKQNQISHFGKAWGTGGACDKQFGQGTF